MSASNDSRPRPPLAAPPSVGSAAEVSVCGLDDGPFREVGPGCRIRDLPASPGVRVWVVDFAAGSEWPFVDEHPTGEDYYVLSGAVIEGDRSFGAGAYVHFAPGSRHRPRSETGARLLGINVVGSLLLPLDQRAK